MVYMDQHIKGKIAPLVKQVLLKYNLKGSLSVNNHSTLTLTIHSGHLDFINNCKQNTLRNYPGSHTEATHMSVNKYHVDRQFDGECLQCVQELLEMMNKLNWCRSEPQYDVFDVGYVVHIQIGRWNKPYCLME